jgi:hypothetical protein
MKPNSEEDGFEMKVPHVLVNGEWIDVEKTEFVNISEDLFGQDVYEFLYDGKGYSSHVILKYKNS